PRLVYPTQIIAPLDGTSYLTLCAGFFESERKFALQGSQYWQQGLAAGNGSMDWQQGLQCSTRWQQQQIFSYAQQNTNRNIVFLIGSSLFYGSIDHVRDQGKMQAKVAVASVSLILAVGLIIGIVVMLSSRNGDEQNNGDGIGTGMKAVKTLCDPTDYKELCMNTLTPVAIKDANVTAKNLVQVALEAILEEVQKALNKFISLGKLELTNTAIDKMSMDDCQQLLQHAVYDLEMAVSKVADSEMDKLSDLLADLNNWLSAVVAYKSSCLDDIINPELQKSILDGLMNTTHLTYNTLGNVDEISKILDKINMSIPLSEKNHKARRLLNVEIDKDGYPTWFSQADPAMGNRFIAKSMGFRNTAGPECEQALALRVESDMSAFFNCSIEGYQDTLFTQMNRQFYTKCNIYGTIDFIFGYAAALIQNSKIIVRKPMAGQFNVITANGREQPQTNSGDMGILFSSDTCHYLGCPVFHLILFGDASVRNPVVNHASPLRQ
ncbi:Pectinesterase/pectinesterase inhibitor, partial [Thalictrum thalictroides]